MSNKIIILLLTALLTNSCKQPETLSDKIIGIWMMEKVYEYDNDVTEKHNPKNNRWIQFKADGSFISDGEPFGHNEGTWKTDDKNSILYLDSNIDDDDSEWKVSFEKDKTIWTGIGHERKENTKLIHKRR